jgi:xanthine dehydrogenase molybdopterin-binding subunit B
MKTISIVTISVTLFVFYNLAVFQQNTRMQNVNINSVSSIVAVETNSHLKTVASKYCMETRDSDQSFQKIEEHHASEDEFAMQVSGKDHRYLNTGISFIAPVAESDDSLNVADSSNDSDLHHLELSGS